MATIPLAEMDLYGDKPVFCWFFGMQPSEYEDLELPDYFRFRAWFTEFTKRSQRGLSSGS